MAKVLIVEDDNLMSRMYQKIFSFEGYEVEIAVDGQEGFEKAKQMMAPVIEKDVRHDIGGDEQRISEIQTEYLSVMFRHLLLPVWIGAYQFSGQTYQVMVNASTGEVQGDRPYSAVKIALLVAAVLLVLMIFFYLKGSS